MSKEQKLPKSNSSRAVAMRLLDSSGGRSGLPGSLTIFNHKLDEPIQVYYENNYEIVKNNFETLNLSSSN